MLSGKLPRQTRIRKWGQEYVNLSAVDFRSIYIRPYLRRADRTRLAFARAVVLPPSALDMLGTSRFSHLFLTSHVHVEQRKYLTRDRPRS